MTDGLNSPTTASDWGPLSEPIHADAAGPDDPVWKDNAFFAFWDLDRQVFGSVHVSTSPNGTGARRARCSVLPRGTDGRMLEIIEDLEPGQFCSPSISFGLEGTITVDHADLTVRLVNAPLYTPADYSTTDLIPPLVPGKPLQHFQQGCTVRGTIESSGQSYEIDGFGMRDRTWGFRDESAQWMEYAAVVGIFDGVFVSAMKFLNADGGMKSDGFVIDDSGSRSVADIRFRRTAAAQFLGATLSLGDGSVRTIEMTSRKAGFFVPMGAETDGPAFGTYDDFMALDCDGISGAGLCEQGIIHRVC